MSYKGGIKMTPVDASGALLSGSQTAGYKGGQKITLVDGDGSLIDLSGSSTDGGVLLVATVADLENIVNPVNNQQVAVQETGTFYQYDAASGVWNPTEVSFVNYYGGQMSNSKIQIYIQRVQTNAQLIEKFGVISDFAITVNQSSVNYSVVGIYPVTFSFTKGRSITCFVEIIPLLKFDDSTIKSETKVLNNAANFLTMYDTELDFSNYELLLSAGADAPVQSGGQFDWIGKSPENVEKVKVKFTNVGTTSNGTVLDCVMSFINSDVYSNNPLYQKWGFDIVSGRIIPKQSGFINFEVKYEFTNADSDIVYLNIATRVDDVHYAKHVGSEVGLTEFFVSQDTLLKGEEFNHPESSIPVFIASRFEGDGDVLGADNIALGIVKQNASSINIVYGKDYTGDINNTNYASENYLYLPFTMRVKELESAREKDFIRIVSDVDVTVEEGTFDILHTFPIGTFRDNAKYEIKASATYTRESAVGNETKTSTIGFRMIQGASEKFDGNVSVAKDSTAATLNLPQLTDQYQFNSTQVATLQAYVDVRTPTANPSVTINSWTISFTEL